MFKFMQISPNCCQTHYQKARHKSSILFVLFYILLFFYTTHSSAGTIKGRVKILTKNSKSGLWVQTNTNQNAVVYITGIKSSKKRKKKPQKINQKGKSFQPRVLAITAGDSVTFPNLDDVFHNVWSLSRSKSFDLGTYKSPKSESVTFDKPGLVKVFCNIHPEMIASILVLKNNYFKVTKKSGKFNFKKVPNGTYKIRIWVEGSKPVSQSITVSNQPIEDLEFEAKINLRDTNHLDKNGKVYKAY